MTVLKKEKQIGRLVSFFFSLFHRHIKATLTVGCATISTAMKDINIQREGAE
jgi:hypothetical protein